MPNTTTSGHAEYSPSALGAFEACPQYTKREDETNAAAEEGTMLHECVENNTLEDLTEEQAGLVQACLDHLEGLSSRYPVIHKEMKLNVCGGATYGTADVVALESETHPRYALICDWKMGRVRVSSPHVNAQGNAYALGLFQKCISLESVIVQFFMPRLGLLMSHEFTRADVPWMTERVLYTIERAQSGQDACAGSHCRFCARLGRCTTFTSSLLPLAERAGFGHSLDTGDLHAIAVDLSPLLKTWAEATRSEAVAMLREGHKIQGYQLKESKGKGSVKDPLALIQLAEAKGVSRDSLLALISKYPMGGVEKLIADSAPRGKKAAFKDEFRAEAVEKGCYSLGVPYQTIEKDADDLDLEKELEKGWI